MLFCLCVGGGDLGRLWKRGRLSRVKEIIHPVIKRMAFRWRERHDDGGGKGQMVELKDNLNCAWGRDVML